MSKLHIRHASAEQRRDFGPVTDAFILKAAYRDLTRHIVWISRFTDDIEPYEADFLLISGVPVLVRRYTSQPADQFTIAVNCEKAREAGFHPLDMPHALLEQLALPDGSLVWTNQELAEQD